MTRLNKVFQAFPVFILTAFVLISSTAATAQSQRALERRAFPQFNLAEKTNGERAITALGARLPEIARWYGMTTQEFARTLREDNSAWLDRHGRLFYIDTLAEPTAEADVDGLTSDAPFPESQTFFLNSRPGANRVIYLDFDGHTISGRVWNSGNTVVSPPYDTDGNVNIFSSAELDTIQNIWRRVAEDYAPFDINVTTQDPGQDAITRSSTADQVFGTRVVITRDNFMSCGCGGYAYLRIFDDVGDYHKPAFVFNTTLKSVAEAITHEAGHNLGLNHDGNASTAYYTGHGSGDTGWAPIMGVGYYKNLVQWSKGEYANANRTEDDIQLIQNYGAPLAADDHGNTNNGATALDTTGDGTSMTISGTGVIHHRDDVDVFRFVSGAGDYSINVGPASASANLDILAQLFNSQGDLVASSNPVSSLGASLSGTALPAGEYFLAIDGVGMGDPLAVGYTDYGSLGHYSVSGTLADAGDLSAPVASISALPLAGYGPLSVDFDGSASSDADGSITDYAWDFGDGNAASGSGSSNVYYAPGNYAASLRVTDNSGLTDTASVDVTVFNRAPYAVASADTATGEAPVTVNFQGSASSDPDAPYGSIVSWHWDFGDGGSSSQANPSYTYNTGGDFTASLTVTDDQGATDTVALSAISIAAPAFTNHYAHGEIAGAGTVSGALANTRYNDGSTQSVREIESGGKKSKRYSYLERTWLFTVQPGAMITLHLNAWRSNSSDGDSIAVAWSGDGGNSFQQITTVENTSDTGTSLFVLPSGIQGEVRIRMRDTDRTSGHRAADTVYVDQLMIRSEAGQGGELPAAPANLAVAGGTSSSLALSWADNASNEYGYVLARSVNGGSWDDQYQTLGENADSFTDAGLSPGTTYSYRVAAYNGAGSSAWSNADSGATPDSPAGELSLTASGYKRKGVRYASLTWSGAVTSQVDVYRDLQLVATVSNSGSYTDKIGGKGGGSFSYEVCEHGTTNCSAAVMVIF